MNLRKLTEDEVTFTTIVTPDETEPDFDDPETLLMVQTQRAAGEIEAWCNIEVRVAWKGFTASSYLCGSSFLGPVDADGETWSVKRQIEETVASHGMRDEALERLNTAISDVFGKLAPLAKRYRPWHPPEGVDRWAPTHRLEIPEADGKLIVPVMLLSNGYAPTLQEWSNDAPKCEFKHRRFGGEGHWYRGGVLLERFTVSQVGA